MSFHFALEKMKIVSQKNSMTILEKQRRDSSCKEGIVLHVSWFSACRSKVLIQKGNRA